MRVGLIGAGLCVLGAACMLAGLAVDLDSTAAKVLIASSAALFVPGVLLTFVWMRIRMGPPR
jgi:predicted RNA methylase